MNDRRYVVTVAPEPIVDPLADEMHTRVFCENISSGVEMFTEYCSSLDTGCVQLFYQNKATGFWYEQGKLYL